MESSGTLRVLGPRRTWSLLSRHGMVIVLLALNPNLTIREISLRLGLTDRTVYSIIRDLATVNMVNVMRVGRNNTYAVNESARLLNPLFTHVPLGRLLEVLKPPARRRRRRRSAQASD